MWWVGAIHFRGGRSIHVHLFHLWHINTHLVNLLKIRMTFRGSSRCRRESNAPAFVILCHCFVGDDGCNTKTHHSAYVCLQQMWVMNSTRMEDFKWNGAFRKKNATHFSSLSWAFMDAIVAAGSHVPKHQTQTQRKNVLSKRILNVATLTLSHISSHVISIIFSKFVL